MITSEDQARAWLRHQLGCDEADMERLAAFVAMLREEATRQNLIAASTLEHVWQRHIVDSLQLLAVSRETVLNEGPWLDLGSGAGLPGLVVALVDPRPMVLVESRGLRVAWLERVIEAIGLRHVSIEGRRLERVETAEASVISARAFAPLGPLLDKAARFSTAKTLWLLPKGASAHKEVKSIRDQWQHVFHVKQSLTDAAAGIITGHLQGRKSAKPSGKRR